MVLLQGMIRVLQEGLLHITNTSIELQCLRKHRQLHQNQTISVWRAQIMRRGGLRLVDGHVFLGSVYIKACSIWKSYRNGRLIDVPCAGISGPSMSLRLFGVLPLHLTWAMTGCSAFRLIAKLANRWSEHMGEPSGSIWDLDKNMLLIIDHSS